MSAEMDSLRAEVERLRRWKAEASEVILGLQDLGKALGLRLGERITGSSATEAAKRLTARAEKAEAERDEVAGRLSALLCDLTGGRLSKPTYDVPTMVQEIEEHLTRELEIDAEAERDRARSLAATLEARLSQEQAKVARVQEVVIEHWPEIPGDALMAALEESA